MHALYHMETEAALHATMGQLAVTGCCFNDCQPISANLYRFLRHLIEPLEAASAVQLLCNPKPV